MAPPNSTSSPSASAAAAAPAPRRRRRVWPWVVALLLLPFVVLGGAAVSLLTLGREVAVLRREVMRATGSEWRPRVQLSAGAVVLGGARAGLHFVQRPGVAEARRVLAAVRRVSVGVYERTAEAAAGPRGDFTAALATMKGRGWTPLVSVQHADESVLVFVTEDGLATGGPLELCLAVVAGRELVVVGLRADPDRLADLADLAARPGRPTLRSALQGWAAR